MPITDIPQPAQNQEQGYKNAKRMAKNATNSMNPGDVFHPNTMKKNEKPTGSNQKRIIVYSVLGVVIVVVVLLFIFL